MADQAAHGADQKEDGGAAKGAARLRRAERRQMELRPMALDELISEDHLARLVWDMVSCFDLSPLLDRVVAREGTAGHPQTDPHILVALWLYATIDGVGSARELARLCEQHHAYRWLCGGVSVNYHTLSDFRVAHAAWLDAELARGMASLLAAGQVSLQSVAQDGLRVRAAAGSSSFRRAPRLQAFLKLAQDRVAQLKAEVATDPAAQKARRQAAATRAANERLSRVKAALAALPAAQARKQRNKGDPARARVSTTDAEARVMKMPDGGFRPAFNVQLAAETEHGLVVGVAVTNSGADQDALDPMHRQVQVAYGRAPANWLVDGGYVSQAGIEQVADRGSKVYAPRGELYDNTSKAICAWRKRMRGKAGKKLYRLRGQTIEWVNAGVRQRGLYGVTVRGIAKVRAVALWHALAHNISRILAKPELSAAFRAA